MAFRYALHEHAFGAGIAHVFLSPAASHDSSRDDSTQVELFARLAVARNLQITVSVQHLRHSGFNAVPGDPRENASVAGLRCRYTF